MADDGNQNWGDLANFGAGAVPALAPPAGPAADVPATLSHVGEASYFIDQLNTRKRAGVPGLEEGTGRAVCHLRRVTDAVLVAEGGVAEGPPWAQRLQTAVASLCINVTALRTDMTALRADVTTLRTDVTALRTNVTALDFRACVSEARLANRAAQRLEDILQGVPAMLPAPQLGGAQFAVPPNFPATVMALQSLNGQPLNALLQAYGVVPAGQLAERLDALRKHIGQGLA